MAGGRSDRGSGQEAGGRRQAGEGRAGGRRQVGQGADRNGQGAGGEANGPRKAGHPSLGVTILQGGCHFLRPMTRSRAAPQADSYRGAAIFCEGGRTTGVGGGQGGGEGWAGGRRQAGEGRTGGRRWVGQGTDRDRTGSGRGSEWGRGSRLSQPGSYYVRNKSLRLPVLACRKGLYKERMRTGPWPWARNFYFPPASPTAMKALSAQPRAWNQHPMRFGSIRGCLAGITVVWLLALASPVLADDTWDGGDGADWWGWNNNWVDNWAPSPAQDLTLTFAGTTRTTPKVGEDVNWPDGSDMNGASFRRGVVEKSWKN